MIANLQDLDKQSIRNMVICYGHFSYLHAGHIRYFNYASKSEKSICVVITTETNGATESAFEIEDRIKLLKKICDINNFVISQHNSLRELIERLENCDLVLGKSSLSHSDLSEEDLRKLLDDVNSRLILLEGDEGKLFETFSYSTEEINSKHIEDFKFRCNNSSIDLRKIAATLKKDSSCNILVIGDLIVDEYVATEPLGISAEAPVIVVRELQSRKYVGGSGVVAKHLSALGGDVSLVSVTGADREAKYVRQNLSESRVKPTLITDSSRPTVYKLRYISGYTKLLRVSRVSKSSLSSSIENQLVENLESLVQKCDAVVVSDFQYGVLNKKTIAHLEMLSERYNKKIFVDIQCSSQVGKINKFSSCFAIFPTEKEARNTSLDAYVDLENLGQDILSLCNSQYCVLKLGEEGLILFERGSQKRFQLPALSVNAIDVAGAGDSLLASVVYGFLNGLTMKESVALGSIVASLNVENLGNEPVAKNKIINRLQALV